MGSQSPENDILDQFRATSNKLKKRFLRKPNVTEANESFAHLAQVCEKSELPSYAGMCWTAAARCEASLGNIPGETSDLIRAGQQFWCAEEKEQEIGCFSPGKENFEAGIGCFANAAICCPEEVQLNVGLSLEIAQKCERFQNKADAELHLLRAVELAKDNLDTRLYTLELLASHYIDQENYTEALNIYSQLIVTLENLPKNGNRTKSSLQYEICSILLLLILRPGVQKISPNQVNLLEKYTWGNYGDKTCTMSEEKFILMQSLVASCQSLDVSNLQSLENELFPLLNTDGQQLLRVLIKIYLE